MKALKTIIYEEHTLSVIMMIKIETMMMMMMMTMTMMMTMIMIMKIMIQRIIISLSRWWSDCTANWRDKWTKVSTLDFKLILNMILVTLTMMTLIILTTMMPMILMMML